MDEKNSHQGTALRLPPHNYEAEQALLGSILVNNRNYEKVSEFLRPEHFAHPLHARIFEVCGSLIDQGSQADPITINESLLSSPGYGDAGGMQYLLKLAPPSAGIVQAADYGRLIRDLAIRRTLIDVGNEMIANAYDPADDTSPAAMIEAATASLFAASDDGADGGANGVTMREATDAALAATEAAMKRKGASIGTLSGFSDLDKILGALPASEMTILAARPAMGKSALAANIAVNVAKAGGAVAFFSLEMDAAPIAQRILSAESGIDSARVRNGNISEAEFYTLRDEKFTIDALQLRIFDQGRMTVARIRAQARRLARTPGGLALLVIDYIQLLAPDSARRNNRVEDVSEITRSLKLLAKELRCPVLALSQLNRAVESRDDKRPMLADLRESGALEQDAAVVMFLFREEYYLAHEDPKPKPGESDSRFRERIVTHADRLEGTKGKAEIGIAKNRFGPTGRAYLHFNGDTVSFGNLARQTEGEFSY